MVDILLVSKLPKRISGLADLAYNLWWSWHLEARDLFKVLDRNLWTANIHNPVKLLKQIPQSSLVAASQNPTFLERYDAVMSEFKKDMAATHTWFSGTYPDMSQHEIAYFSLEFAIHNSLPMYAGGLGILTGDYCKEASDLGLPMVAVGFMYPQGYFQQRISIDGWEEELYEPLNTKESPIEPVFTPKGKQLKIEIFLAGHPVYLTTWQVNVGRVKLYLLDTSSDENLPTDRQLSARLYIGDRETRLKQEIVIGVGGVRILRSLGLKPCIWHANEGHVSFMMLERVRELVEQGRTFTEAIEEVRQCTIFTTHTPIPAGNDTFPFEMVAKYLEPFWTELKLDRQTLLNLGTYKTNGDLFNMTVLGLNMSSQRNGVSQLHGDTCRRIWHPLWPDKTENEVPIVYVTNGIHVPTWVSPQAVRIYNEYLGKDWLKNHDDTLLWQKVLEIPDEKIWETRRWLKNKLIRAMEDRIRRRWSEEMLSPTQSLAMGSLMDPETLTLGFCRRATEYKRATLIFNDLNRLKKILKNNLQPIQIIFAGKAHPDDIIGKYLIQEIYKLAKDPEFEGRIAFVENYDLHMARFLVHGIDVWLNNPRWLEEASGTSGMKSSLNGGLNLSALDGWWFEGYNGNNGWALQKISETSDVASQNKVDAEQIYKILEEKVVPIYYERDINGIPHEWIKIIKESIRSVVPFFNTRRMLKEYTQSMYLNSFAICHRHEEKDELTKTPDYSI